ncbi:hypothetical protein HN51_070129 [Arachis hypogaea]|uniref:Agenet domain-containing protein n=1 Tax=Arachis hypogaea TaxID=3818 RepID=A0A444Z366_ARAHY|nr:uncharacterized protein DS421_15g507130 [Arachis hypogaea]RYR08631.1 hypothetical protein Ahy_B05g076423 isoform B [Arachis hypogaea]
MGQMNMPHVGSQIEVLSQDSGIGGCWFRACVIKKHKDKVKIQYQDIQDAVDEAKKLQEWVLASRIAVVDNLDIRMKGRVTIRPMPLSSKNEISWVGDVGSVVDAWWLDGWGGKALLFEKNLSPIIMFIFQVKRLCYLSDLVIGKLRQSQDLTVNRWVIVRERPDLMTNALSSLNMKQNPCKASVASPGKGLPSKKANTYFDTECEL